MRGSLNTAPVRSCEAHPTQTITHARPARPPHLHRALVHSRLLLVVQPARGTVIRAASGERQPRGGDDHDAQRCTIARAPTHLPPWARPCWRTYRSHLPSQTHCPNQTRSPAPSLGLALAGKSSNNVAQPDPRTTCPSHAQEAAPPAHLGLPSPVGLGPASQTHAPPAQAIHTHRGSPLTWACPRRRTPGSRWRTPRPPQTPRPPPVNRSGG